jgi:hypothetical protein
VIEDNELEAAQKCVPSQLKSCRYKTHWNFKFISNYSDTQRWFNMLADPTGYYPHSSPSWSTIATHPFPNTPTPQQAFRHMEEAE